MDLLRAFVVFSLFVSINSISLSHHWKKNKLIELEELLITGSTTILTKEEKNVNSILMSYKHEEIDEGILNPITFNLERHFFLSAGDIELSKLFNILKLFPKGASLHGHDLALVSEEFLYNLTFSDHLYACISNGDLRLHFFKVPDDSCDWSLVSDLRATDSDFDDLLKKELTLHVFNPNYKYPDRMSVWKALNKLFATVTPLVTYRPIWKSYFYQVFKEHHDDNIMYMEFRTVLPNLYDLDGTVYGPEDCVEVILDALRDFVKDCPDFLGARMIYAPLRTVDNVTAEHYVQTALTLKKKYEDFFAGFDLVGQEDLGRPLDHFITQLEELKKNGVKFFFHAGETNWFGTSIDNNLFDSVMLGSYRIGGAQALIKHPELLKLVKLKNIAIEVTPLSSHILKIVGDVRNHPGAYLIANDYPVVIGNDDPGFWKVKGLTYDWYYCFLGMTSRNTDLRFLKKLALNSIEYSAMPSNEKAIAVKEWYKRWDLFIATIVKNTAIFGGIKEAN